MGVCSGRVFLGQTGWFVQTAVCDTGSATLPFLRVFIHSFIHAFIHSVMFLLRLLGTVCTHLRRVNRPGPLLQAVGREAGSYQCTTRQRQLCPRDCYVPSMSHRCLVARLGQQPPLCRVGVISSHLQVREGRSESWSDTGLRDWKPSCPTAALGLHCLCTGPWKPGKHHTCAPGCGRSQRAETGFSRPS